MTKLSKQIRVITSVTKYRNYYLEVDKEEWGKMSIYDKNNYLIDRIRPYMIDKNEVIEAIEEED